MRSRWLLLALPAAFVCSLALGAVAASAASIVTYAGCSTSETATPSHVCHVGDEVGAFFEADFETEYEICVTFPDTETLCVEEPPAEPEVLYVNEITTDEIGSHLVSWYIEGAEVASWSFRLDAAPSPPLPPAAPVIPPPPPPSAVAPTAPTAKCLQAQKRVKSLATRLSKAKGHQAKVRIRATLKSAKGSTKKACA